MGQKAHAVYDRIILQGMISKPALITNWKKAKIMTQKVEVRPDRALCKAV